MMIIFTFYLGLFPHHNPSCEVKDGIITLTYTYPMGYNVIKKRKVKNGIFRLNNRFFKAPKIDGTYSFNNLLLK